MIEVPHGWQIKPALLAAENTNHRRLWAVKFLLLYEAREQPQTNGNGHLVAKAALGMLPNQTLAEAGFLVAL
jgi:hypothetical protein